MNIHSYLKTMSHIYCWNSSVTSWHEMYEGIAENIDHESYVMLHVLDCDHDADGHVGVLVRRNEYASGL